MNKKNTGGAVAILAMCGLISFAIWVTQTSDPLWALILVVWFASDFPWDSEK